MLCTKYLHWLHYFDICLKNVTNLMPSTDSVENRMAEMLKISKKLPPGFFTSFEYLNERRIIWHRKLNLRLVWLMTSEHFYFVQTWNKRAFHFALINESIICQKISFVRLTFSWEEVFQSFLSTNLHGMLSFFKAAAKVRWKSRPAFNFTM